MNDAVLPPNEQEGSQTDLLCVAAKDMPKRYQSLAAKDTNTQTARAVQKKLWVI
jgi:hypothetical protein